MEDFTFYFGLGWQHIVSFDAIDHILFLLALTAIYLLQNKKQVLILVTAFTIGHSLTFALSTYDIIRLNSKWVEFLIPLTIVLTAGFNFFQKDFQPKSLRINYLLALSFGLIHGMGFANTIRMMLANSQTIAFPLLSFNLGLEAGQIIIVSVILSLAFIFISKLGFPRKLWVWLLSGIAFIMGIYFCLSRMPF